MKSHQQQFDNIGILLINLGTPDAPTTTAVRRYLRQFLSDKRVIDMPRLLWWPLLYACILPLRSPRVAKLYKGIWQSEGSPLLVNTRVQAEKLAQLFAKEANIHLEFAMCYGQPSIAQALERLKAKSIRQLLIFPLYPQYSATTVAASFDAVSSELRHWHYMPAIRMISGYADDPSYIDALASRVRTHWEQTGQRAMLLISFHGLPQRYFERGDPYYCFCHKTARLLAQALQLKEHEWRMVFQSRFGFEAWLQPYCDKTLIELATQGVSEVDVICPGFAADCLETLEEIKQSYSALFRHHGGKILRIYSSIK